MAVHRGVNAEPHLHNQILVFCLTKTENNRTLEKSCSLLVTIFGLTFVMIFQHIWRFLQKYYTVILLQTDGQTDVTIDGRTGGWTDITLHNRLL